MDTIAAIAPPPGEGGVGIIRISGPEAPLIAQGVWRGKLPLPDFESHRLYYGDIAGLDHGFDNTTPTAKKAEPKDVSLQDTTCFDL